MVTTNPVKILQMKTGAVPDGQFGPNTFRMVSKMFGLTSVRAIHFFAQCAHETGNFRVFSENLNYSQTGLKKIFKKYFPTNAIAAAYARNPEKIANRVYANRMGNGDEFSGDGWRYRGRGAIQLTGKYKYTLFAKYIQRPDVLTTPDIIALELAFESALFFFEVNRLWSICDRGLDRDTIISLTRKINGGTHGLDDRINKTRQFANWS